MLLFLTDVLLGLFWVDVSFYYSVLLQCVYVLVHVWDKIDADSSEMYERMNEWVSERMNEGINEWDAFKCGRACLLADVTF